MGLDLLDNPIRVTWDLHAAGTAMSDSDARTVLQRVLDAQVFFVTLEQTPILHSECESILSHLSGQGIQTLLLSNGSAAELRKLSLLADQSLVVLLNLQPFLRQGAPDFEQLRMVVTSMRQSGVNPGFSMTPSRFNIDSLVPLLGFAAEMEIPRFKLPNVRIDANFQQSGREQVLRPADLEKLSQNLPDLTSLTGHIDLEIHDLFLWELLTPGSAKSRSEYGGCQAANSLAHINTDATVLPCVSWPEALGSLLDSSFAQIWASAECQRIRRSIAQMPTGCVDCRDYQLCYGGCRGLSDVLDIDRGLDPMCSGPR
jgi:GeoRSP system SPASM domain protein